MGNILKTAVILSAIAGFAAGVLLLIPFLTPLIFLMLFIAIGAGIIVYIKRHNFVGFLTIQDGALIGAISGFISLSAASVIYLPVWLIISLIFNKHTFSFGISSPMTDFIIVLMMVFFVALLSAVFNAFSAMIATYIYEKIEDKPFEFNTNFEIDQDE